MLTLVGASARDVERKVRDRGPIARQQAKFAGRKEPQILHLLTPSFHCPCLEPFAKIDGDEEGAKQGGKDARLVALIVRRLVAIAWLLQRSRPDTKVGEDITYGIEDADAVMVFPITDVTAYYRPGERKEERDTSQ